VSGPRFVAVPADRLVAELDAIGAAVTARGGTASWGRAGAERVYDVTVPRSPGIVRVYTSLALGADEVRDCGKDAVRVCVGAVVDGAFKPTESGTKILRTAPQGAEDRVAVFLARLRQALRDAYVRARAIRTCRKCGRPMARREGPHGAFLGCTGYPSACREVMQIPA